MLKPINTEHYVKARYQPTWNFLLFLPHALNSLNFPRIQLLLSVFPTWLLISVRYLTTMGIRYSKNAVGNFGRLSCRKMAIGGICSISSVRTVGSGNKSQNYISKHEMKIRYLKKKSGIFLKCFHNRGKFKQSKDKNSITEIACS